jgi:8-oxo-dGTP diphosphatase
MDKKTEVAIGILCDDEGRLLVGRRMFPPHAGKWEMPGGKVEIGETVEEALRREFLEEGGAVLDAIARWTRIQDDFHILHLFKVFSEDPFIPTIYAEYRYAAADELDDLDWIESNRAFVPDLRDIITSNPTIETITYRLSTLEMLEECLDEIESSFHARHRFTRISCILEADALPFQGDVPLTKKVEAMYHEGVGFYTTQQPPATLPGYILSKERG